MNHQPSLSNTHHVDVLVVGGGAAGLSAALMLGRSRRSVLVVDDGKPRNAPSTAVHAFLTRDGIPPQELLRLGYDETVRYGVEHRNARVVRVSRIDNGFIGELDNGETVRARRLLVTTGLVDELPPIAGLAERWGRDVIHCPFCHGWEVRDQTIGVLATSPKAMHQVGLFRQLSDDIILLSHTGGERDADQTALLAARDVKVVDGTVTAVTVRGDQLVGVELDDGSYVPLSALAIAPRFVAKSDLLEQLGLPAVEHPSGAGMHIPANPMGQTDVEGVWVAGNITEPMAQVMASAAQGATAGAGLNGDLVAEDNRLALQGVLCPTTMRSRNSGTSSTPLTGSSPRNGRDTPTAL